MGYSRSAIQGIGWNGLLKIATVVIAAVKIFALARLLTPRDFGLFSLVAICLGLMESLTETGINTTIVQSPKRVTYFLDTAWVISIARGLIISIFMLLIGLGMQYVYGEPQLLFFIAISTFIPIIRGFINPSVVLLQKELLFFRDTMLRFVLLCIDFAVAVLAAFFIHSPMVFILGMLGSAIVEVAFSFIFFAERPRFSFLPSRAQEIFHNAKGLSVSAILGYVIQNVDNLILGKVLGTAELGLYSNGYNLSHKLNVELAKSVQQGTFPVYVKIAHEHERLKRAFLRTTLLASIGFLLIAVPFFFFSPQFVHLFLGSKWQGVEQLLPWFMVAGLLQSIVVLSTPLFIAKKKYWIFNFALFVQCIVLVPALLFFSQRAGVLGGVFAILLARAVTVPVIGLGLWQIFTQPSYHSRSAY